MVEDRALELLQRPARVDAELVDEGAAAVLVRGKRFGLPAAAVERQHQLTAQPLAEGVLRDQPLQLADDLRMSPQLEVGLQPLLEAFEPELAEPGDLVLCKARVRDVGER